MPDVNKTVNMDELMSTNAFAVIELVDGTKIKSQITMRYGLHATEALAQLDEWTAFLEGATSRGVKFEGPAPSIPVPTGQAESIPPGTPDPTTGEIPMPPEPHYEELDGAQVFTIATVHHDLTSTKKDILKVITVEVGPDKRKPYNGKYGVTCFHPGPEFDGWKQWPIGTKYAPPATIKHVVIRPATEASKYPDVIEFRA